MTRDGAATRHPEAAKTSTNAFATAASSGREKALSVTPERAARCYAEKPARRGKIREKACFLSRGTRTGAVLAQQ
ncbi:hypothetical protein [Pseudomonas sp. Gutcm_11s]|uniref:hypothetical protein n=1 Tax=Pseudomonas sp. Gutcm_11s TaxID=3026088 RepID=UPI00235DCEF8|nr:hypothetical protein [Pseudomonas sp. Gutcm_11s]MDD0843969.1 hypothetical protein [Pseudomonas sp. Gutcm_11s]